MTNETPVTKNKTIEPKPSLRFKIGVFFLIALMSFAFYNDISRIFGS